MGKRGKGRRSGGGCGKRSSPGAGRSAGVASSSTGSFRGIVDPSFLAQQAAAAASADVRSLSARSSTGAARAGGAAGRANTSSRGTRKKGKVNKVSPSASARQHGGDGRGVSRPKKRPRIDERKQSAETDMSRSTFSSTMEDTRIVATFGHSTWKNCEQLTRLLMFPPPTIIAATVNNSSNHTTETDETLSTKRTALRLVFVSDADTARELAALYKPAVHPLPSYACHTKVKGGQLSNMVDEIVNIIATVPANDDDAGDGYDEILCLRGPVLFVADHALDRLISAFRRVAGSKKRKQTQSLNSGHIIGSAGNLLGIHYDGPRSGAILDSRRRSLDILSSLLRCDSGSSSVPPLQLVLDGCDAVSAFVPAFADAPMICYNNVIPTSDQSICQAIINTAARVRKAASGSQKQRAAQEKLLAHVTILEIKLLRAKRDNSKLELPKVSGLEGKISNVVEKMRILGMIGPAASCDSSEREAALTKWMDGAKGEEYGASWKGSVRRGASGDDVSRNLASLLAGWKAADGNNDDDQDDESGSSVLECRPCGQGGAWCSLRRWRPNPTCGYALGINTNAVDSSDEDRSARRDFGDHPCAKSCGHNETAMFFLRPFFPLEVLNSRVCSRRSPAPGNSGYDGCLEYLQRLCAAAGRSLTFWDSECFCLIDGQSRIGLGGLAKVACLRKRELLHLSKESLAWLMTSGRQLAVTDALERAGLSLVTMPRSTTSQVVGAVSPTPTNPLSGLSQELMEKAIAVRLSSS